MKYFRELDLKNLQGKTIILDIDGTIVKDKSNQIDFLEKQKLEELKNISNKVILVSNGHNDRTDTFGKEHTVDVLLSNFKKPNIKVLKDLHGSISRHDLVVIGDKFFTDGLLAVQKRVPFLHVKSLAHAEESFFNKVVYFVDDLLGIGYELFRLARPHQWVKNLLVFAPLFFAHQIFDLLLLLKAGVAFAAFSAAASFIYVLNDYKDQHADSLHDKKKWRPIPLGVISLTHVYVFLFFLTLILGVIFTTLPGLFMVLGIYILFNIIYTQYFKHIPVLDIVSVSSMYVFRIIAGGVATAVYISPWIVTCTFFASLFLASAKRYSEFTRQDKHKTRKVLSQYTRETLLSILVISTTLSIISYVMYTFIAVKNELAVFSSIFVVVVFLKLLNDIFKEREGLESPEVYILKDRIVFLCMLVWAIFMFVLVYGI